jgi:hypothetical protein
MAQLHGLRSTERRDWRQLQILYFTFPLPFLVIRAYFCECNNEFNMTTLSTSNVGYEAECTSVRRGLHQLITNRLQMAETHFQTVWQHGFGTLDVASNGSKIIVGPSPRHALGLAIVSTLKGLASYDENDLEEALTRAWASELAAREREKYVRKAIGSEIDDLSRRHLDAMLLGSRCAQAESYLLGSLVQFIQESYLKVRN